MQPETRQPREHLPALDGLRALAIAAVLANHSSYGWFEAGFLGVDIFFVLSGFLITRILLSEWNLTGRINYARFLQRRAIRLLPALLVALGLAGALWRVGEVESAGWPWMPAALATLGCVANFVTAHLNKLEHAWSLSLEAQFYFVWPFLLAAILRRWQGRSAALVMAFLALFCGIFRAFFFWLAVDNRDWLFTSPFSRADGLFLGAMIATLPSQATTQAMQKLGRWQFPLLLVIAILPFLHDFDMTAPFLYQGGFTVFAALFALMLVLALHLPEANAGRWLLGTAFCRWMAQRSYGIYLYHNPIFAAMEALRHSGSRANLIGVTFLRVATTLFVAEISYRYIEQPLLRFRKTPRGSAPLPH